jgi:hypothetical protein
MNSFESQPFPEEPQSAALYRYKLFGLRIASELKLSDLHEDETPDHDADVVIRTGRVPVVEGCDFSSGPEGVALQIENVAAYLIRDGKEILIEPAARAAERNVRLYLLGTAMGVILHQRRLLPLHANAIEIGGAGVAFTGESGAGKSTLAAWLHDNGHRIITDDVCVLRYDEDRTRVRVLPGLPRIRLWKDALKHTGRNPADYQLSYFGDDAYEKFDVPLERRTSATAGLDLSAIYVLSRGEGFSISRMSGADAVEAIFSHTYRGFLVPVLGQSGDHFRTCVEIARSTPVFRLQRRRMISDMAHDTASIVAHAEQL